MLAESELLERCRAGDGAAWDELFDRHYAPAGRFVAQLSTDLNRDDIEEICQETFLTVVRNLHTFQGNCQFQTWLFRIAVNKAHDHRERQRAAKRGGGRIPLSLQMEDPETGRAIDPPGNTPPPDLELIGRENLELVAEAVAELGEPCREVVELRYFGDLSYEEIAETLQLNPKTVSSRLSKCLDKLEVVIRRLFRRENRGTLPVKQP